MPQRHLTLSQPGGTVMVGDTAVVADSGSFDIVKPNQEFFAFLRRRSDRPVYEALYGPSGLLQYNFARGVVPIPKSARVVAEFGQGGPLQVEEVLALLRKLKTE
jgi:hypothetical protein